jgi:hypothetical protein
MDKVCEQLKSFWTLDLSRSQADALKTQLPREWESEFESLWMLLAVSAVIHADAINWRRNSAWAFAPPNHLQKPHAERTEENFCRSFLLPSWERGLAMSSYPTAPVSVKSAPDQP